LVSSEITTRSGFFAAIASTLGLNPDRSLRGAFVGKFDLSSTATTWPFASIAYSISVAVGDSDTIRSGRVLRVTPPAVAGNCAVNDGAPLVAGAAVPPQPPSRPAIASAAKNNRLLIISSCRAVVLRRREKLEYPPTRRPSARARVATGGRRPGSSPSAARGIAVAGQLRGHTGFAAGRSVER
jgi:hypothetical protein